MPTLVKTKYTFDLRAGVMTPNVTSSTPAHVGDECEITATDDCVIVFNDPRLFGIWKAKLKKNEPKTFTVKREGLCTNWVIIDAETYKAQEPHDKSEITKATMMGQNPPVLP